MLGDNKESILYMYTLFANDSTNEAFHFGMDLLSEYIDSSIEELLPNSPESPSSEADKFKAQFSDETRKKLFKKEMKKT